PRLQGDATPRVSIVVIATEDSSGLRRALASVCAQTYRNLELVLVDARGDRAGSEPWADLAAGAAFPHALVPHAPAEEAVLLNAGVRASTGEFVSALCAADELSAERIRTFVEQVANRDGAWGFGDIDFVAADASDATAQARVQRWRALLDGVLDLDTV